MAIRRTVFFAKVTRKLRLFDRSFGEDFLEAVQPGGSVTRYHRTWRFSRPRLTQSQFIRGKLGFVQLGEEEIADYDEKLQDFVTRKSVARQAHYSHFVADTDTEILAFEERQPDIRRQSFLGAFRGLIALADFEADVELLSDASSFPEWASKVDRVTRVRAVVHRPNPGYAEDAHAIRDLIEQSGAETVEVLAKPAPGASLDPTAEWIQGALTQVSEHGQGTVAATGQRGESLTQWISERRVRMESIEEEASEESNTIWGKLQERLGLIRDR